jgi:cobalt/nickel transport system permease protein
VDHVARLAPGDTPGRDDLDMSGGHHQLGTGHAPMNTPVHSIDAAVKEVCLLGSVFAVVATPARPMPAFAVYTLLVLGVTAQARLPFQVLARRLLIEVPFVAFAVALPFISGGPHRDILGVSVSIARCWAA